MTPSPDLSTPEPAFESLPSADDLGSSSRFRDLWWGDDTGIIFEQRGFLTRRKLRAFLDSCDEETERFDLSLLEPFDDE